MLKAAMTLGLVLGLAAPAMAKAPHRDLGASRPGATEVAKKKKKEEKKEETKDADGTTKTEKTEKTEETKPQN